MIIIVNRFEPTSKTCSSCGAIKSSLKLSDREYTCAECGVSIDRDLNAAINICTVGLTGTGVDVYTNACGDFSSGLIFDISGETKIVESGKIWNLEKVAV